MQTADGLPGARRAGMDARSTARGRKLMVTEASSTLCRRRRQSVGAAQTVKVMTEVVRMRDVAWRRASVLASILN